MKMTITRTKTKEEGTQEEKNVRQKRRKESPEPARLLAGPEVTLAHGLDNGLPLVVPLLAKLEVEDVDAGEVLRRVDAKVFEVLGDCGLDLGVGRDGVVAINGGESALRLAPRHFLETIISLAVASSKQEA